MEPASTEDVASAEENQPLEQLGSYTLSRYQVTTRDNETLALHRVGTAPFEADRPVVVLVHGTYTNRRFWISRSGKGLAPYLYEAGYDVWMPETRGHGYSSETPRYSDWTARDVASEDLPAFAGFIQRLNGGKQHWVGHSYGGVYLLAALSMGWLKQDNLAAVAVFGSQVKEGQSYLRFTPLNWLLRTTVWMIGHLPARLLKMGSEDEPPGITNEALHWKQSGQWRSLQGEEYDRGLEGLQLPVFAAGASADTMDPPKGCRELFEAIGSDAKTFRELGKANGYRRDYQHVDMLIGPHAEAEVWPELRHWLDGLNQVRN